MIRSNAHKYSLSAMCKVLQIKRSTYYYNVSLENKDVKNQEDVILSQDIKRIFKASRSNYGTRKIKRELIKSAEPKYISRRRIARLMKEMNLVLNYTMAQFKVHKSSSNESTVKNKLKRTFTQKKKLTVVVSSLRYFRVEKNGIMSVYS